jgi:hypothetical protein
MARMYAFAMSSSDHARGRNDGASYAETLEHGWRYFALHAGQRLTLFNYFIAVSGVILAGGAAALQGTARFSLLGVALGLLLVLLALVFHKLDQRTSALIKISEQVLAATERQCIPPEARLFAPEIDSGTSGVLDPSAAGWTYGRSLRLSFLVVGILGLALCVLSLLRAADMLRWESAGAVPSVSAHAPSRDAEISDARQNAAKPHLRSERIAPPDNVVR